MSARGIICEEEPQVCELCGRYDETRPYGPNNEEICFECGQKDKETTKKKMDEFLFGDE